MPTNVRGRSGEQSGRGSIDRTTRSNKQSGATKGSISSSNVSSGFKNCNTSFSNKIQSFKTLCTQTTGPGKSSRPSPATLNTLANWINKGAVIQTVTTAQIKRWAKATRQNVSSNQTPSTQTCKNVLSSKFGKSTIKAVTPNKSGSFLVATAPIVNGKKFAIPK